MRNREFNNLIYAINKYNIVRMSSSDLYQKMTSKQIWKVNYIDKLDVQNIPNLTIQVSNNYYMDLDYRYNDIIWSDLISLSMTKKEFIKYLNMRAFW